MDAIALIASPLGMLRLRPEQADDGPFGYQLFCDSPARMVRGALDRVVRDRVMRMQFGAQTTTYTARFPKAYFDIIELAGAPVGRIVINGPGVMVHIVDHAIVPSLRNRGIARRACGL